MAKADHWSELGAASQWARVGELLSRDDPVAAGQAWQRAADGYQAYYDAWQAHLPASRWDYDYGPELSLARDRARRGPTLAPPDARPRMPLVELAVGGRLDDAVTAATERPTSRAARAILGILAAHCDREGRADDARRLAGWAKETPLGEIGAAFARGVSAATGEPLSHLDYPEGTASADVACITIGIEREGLWRGVGLVLDRGPLRAAYAPSPDGAARELELGDDDPSLAVLAVVEHLRAIGPGTPPLDVVNVVCDGLQILCGSVVVPGTRWLPRFSMAEAGCASIDLDGPPWIAWPDLVTVRSRGASHGARVEIAVEAAHGASGIRVEVGSAQELIAAAPVVSGLVRTIVDRRAIARAGR